ncbi:MAG: hypothetical protein NT154_15025, partial [Verrucomicrobia bacterium]|nr:hypothetical protein [Verrucomicrobiota bacterium]
MRIVENRERALFLAEFRFELTGVVWNGRTRSNVEQRQNAFGTSGDRLASKLLALLRKNAEVRFMFSGGAATNFSWSIQGCIREAASQEIAIAEAANLRQGLQMILASEPSFNFVPHMFSAPERTKPTGFLWKTTIIPRRASLTIPAQISFGFGRANQETEAKGQTVKIALPRSGATSFRSLAEAVLLSATPIQLSI